jgi:hypothetical protein
MQSNNSISHNNHNYNYNYFCQHLTPVLELIILHTVRIFNMNVSNKFINHSVLEYLTGLYFNDGHV